MSTAPKTIVPIRPKNFPEFLELTKNILNRTDMIEIWLDQVEDINVFLRGFLGFRKELVNTNKWLKFLAVCKKSSEKGSFVGTKEERVEILQKFLESGGDFVDLDVTQNSTKNIQRIPPEKLWLSFHDFTGEVLGGSVDVSCRNTLEEIAKSMQKTSPSLFKFAIAVNSSGGLERFLEFAIKFRQRVELPSIFTTMGKYGAMGREILSQKNLTDYAFFAASEEAKTAPGQPVLS